MLSLAGNAEFPLICSIFFPLFSTISLHLSVTFLLFDLLLIVGCVSLLPTTLPPNPLINIYPCCFIWPQKLQKHFVSGKQNVVVCELKWFTKYLPLMAKKMMILTS